MDARRKNEIRKLINIISYSEYGDIELAPIIQELLDALDKADVRAESLKIEYERVNKRMLAIADGYGIVLERMHEKENWAAAWKRKAKMLRDDVRKCHGMANEINILVAGGRKVEAENKRLKDMLTSLTDAANLYLMQSFTSRRHKLRDAVDEAKKILGEP